MCSYDTIRYDTIEEINCHAAVSLTALWHCIIVIFSRFQLLTALFLLLDVSSKLWQMWTDLQISFTIRLPRLRFMYNNKDFHIMELNVCVVVVLDVGCWMISMAVYCMLMTLSFCHTLLMLSESCWTFVTNLPLILMSSSIVASLWLWELVQGLMWHVHHFSYVAVNWNLFHLLNILVFV